MIVLPRFLLDTNICIYVIRERPARLRETFAAAAGRMALSSITLAELQHGVERSSDPPRNQRVLDDFCSRLMVLDYGARAAIHYGAIRASLERAGLSIGVNDLHIAAHARSEGLVLVTNNRREFDRIEGLQVENWAG